MKRWDEGCWTTTVAQRSLPTIEAFAGKGLDLVGRDTVVLSESCRGVACCTCESLTATGIS